MMFRFLLAVLVNVDPRFLTVRKQKWVFFLIKNAVLKIRVVYECLQQGPLATIVL